MNDILDDIYSQQAIGGGVLMPSRRARANNNPWIDFLKQYANQHHMTYQQAMKDPKAKKLYYNL